MKHQTKYAIILGPNGAGKGKTCKALHDEHGHNGGFIHVEMSEVLRARRRWDKNFDRMAAEYMAERKLVPCDATNRVLKDYLVKLRHDRRKAFDGAPRTWKQAKFLLHHLRETDPEGIITVIQLDLNEIGVVRNCTKRFNEEGRADDAEIEKIVSFYRTYLDEIGPVLDHFTANGIKPKLVNADVPEHEQIAEVKRILG